MKQWLQNVARLNELSQKVDDMALTLEQFKAELQQRADNLTAEVTALKTVEQSVETLLNGQSAQLAALRAQVADLLAAQGIDPATVQPILDAFDAQITAAEQTRTALATAVQANTVTP